MRVSESDLITERILGTLSESEDNGHRISEYLNPGSGSYVELAHWARLTVF